MRARMAGLALAALLACGAVARCDAATVDPPVGRELSARERETWRATLRWDDDCERRFGGEQESGGLRFDLLRPRLYLAELTCSLGAYQAQYRFYTLDMSTAPLQAKALEFEQLTDSGEPGPDRYELNTSTEVGGDPHFDTRRGVLAMLDRFRALGDCGALTTYAISKTSARIVEMRVKSSCDGKGANAERSWPLFPYQKYRTSRR